MNYDYEEIHIQSAQYEFPYHWLPEIKGAKIAVARRLQWGLEYLGYMCFVRDQIAKLQPLSILDVGCGDGRMASLIYAVQDADYLGVDLSEKAIQLAKILNRKGSFQVQTNGEVGRKFDVVIATEVLEHIPDQQLPSFLAGVKKSMDTESRFLATVPSDIRPTHKKHFRHYNELMLTSTLRSAGFEVRSLIYLHKENMVSRLLQMFITNRFYSLHASLLTQWVWRLYKTHCLKAAANNGAHIYVECMLAQ